MVVMMVVLVIYGGYIFLSRPPTPDYGFPSGFMSINDDRKYPKCAMRVADVTVLGHSWRDP